MDAIRWRVLRRRKTPSCAGTAPRGGGAAAADRVARAAPRRGSRAALVRHRHADGSLALCPLKTTDTYINLALELALSAAEAVARLILRVDRRPAVARSAAPAPGPGLSSPPSDQQASTPRTPRN